MLIVKYPTKNSPTKYKIGPFLDYELNSDEN